MDKMAKATEILMDMSMQIKDAPDYTKEKEDALHLAVNVMLLVKGAVSPMQTLFELFKDVDICDKTK